MEKIDPSLYATEKRLNKLSGVLAKRQTTFTIVLENINDPHNFSAVLRSCDAIGIMDVHMVYHSGQDYPKLGRQSSASAKKWVDVTKHDSVEECYEYLRKEGKKIFTTHMSKEAVSLYDLKLDEPVALVFGNEHAGVSEKAVELADGNFLIPQVGMIQSLNISVACAVSVYEAFRQRNNSGLYDKSELSEDAFDAKLADWVRRK